MAAPFFHKITIRTGITKEADTRTFMRHTLIHTYYRIKQHRELWAQLSWSVSTYCRSQMATSRKTLYADIVWINMPLLRIFLKSLYCLINIR